MLNKKSKEITDDIFSTLFIHREDYHFSEIQPLILKYLETVYLQGRKDQVDKVTFEQDSDGSLTFRSE